MWPRVVDHDVERAGLGDELLHRGVDRALRLHVELQYLQPPSRALRQVTELRGIAGVSPPKTNTRGIAGGIADQEIPIS